MAMAMTAYHGGPGGLSPGDELLPPSATGIGPPSGVPPFNPKTGLREFNPETGRRDLPLHECTHVFFSTDLWLALDYTRDQGGSGLVYEVEPHGPIEPDPDPCHRPGVAWQCESATILRVARPGLTKQEIGELEALNERIDAEPDGNAVATLRLLADRDTWPDVPPELLESHLADRESYLDDYLADFLEREPLALAGDAVRAEYASPQAWIRRRISERRADA